MPFEWLQPHVPEAVRSADQTRRLQGCEHDVRVRAALLQRLGRDQSTTLRRCLGDLRWAYEVGGTSPLTDDQVTAIVADVYAKRPGQ